MKIVGVACSPRKGKATAYALEGTMTSQCKAFLDRCVRNLGKRVAELANRLHR